MILVSAAGFEPATHALKEYSALDSRSSKSEHKARGSPVFTPVKSLSIYCCYICAIPAI
jgi:hypothetical protein